MDFKSIVVADAQYLIRLGLKNLIRNSMDFKVVGEASCEEDLLNILSSKKVNVVILDYNQPKSFEVGSIQRIKKFSPNTNILIISSDNTRNNIYEILELGVSGFLTKQCEEEEIQNAIKATAKGEKFFCNNVLNYILEKSFSAEEEGDCSPTPLTFREIQVVKLVATGKIAKEIASDLNLSIHTVYTHRKNIMRKLELSSTSELVIYAINHGIIEADLANT